MTKIVHIRNKYDTYIGRPTIFGNPFKIGKDGNRDEVIEKYKLYFYTRIAIDKEFEEEVKLLKDKVLGCYCKPERCHGDIIKEYLDGITGEIYI